MRFRTLGCYPLTGAIESHADNAAGDRRRDAAARTSERQGRSSTTTRRHRWRRRSARAISDGAGAVAAATRGRRASLLRFSPAAASTTARSTLIGRLLYDSKPLFDDQLAALEARRRKASARTGETSIFALLVDGLEAEREQGITIDVAYRFFATDAREFIVADTPGHEQYTRNMATGASTAELAVILIDARKGVLTQTRRHAYIVSPARHPPRRARRQQDRPGRLLSETASTRSSRNSRRSPSSLGFAAGHRHPDLGAASATTSSRRARAMPWYDGPALLEHLENVDVDAALRGQAVPHAGAMGQPAEPRFSRLRRHDRSGGSVRPGDRDRGRCRRAEQHTSRASSPATATSTRPSPAEAVTLTLADEIDISRGDVLLQPTGAPDVSDQFAAHLLWMATRAMLPGRHICSRSAPRTVPATVTRAQAQGRRQHAASTWRRKTLALNEIGCRNLAARPPVALRSLRATTATPAASS